MPTITIRINGSLEMGSGNNAVKTVPINIGSMYTTDEDGKVKQVDLPPDDFVIQGFDAGIAGIVQYMKDVIDNCYYIKGSFTVVTDEALGWVGGNYLASKSKTYKIDSLADLENARLCISATKDGACASLSKFGRMSVIRAKPDAAQILDRLNSELPTPRDKRVKLAPPPL